MTTTLLRYKATDAPGGKQIFSSAPPGGVDLIHSYRAEKQPDGNFTIQGLDIFKATTRKNPRTGDMDVFDEQWMLDAIRNFDELKADGYLPPAHVGHHSESGVNRPLAGHIGRLWVDKDKKGVPTLFADVVDVPPDVFQQLAQKRLPYRSIEVNRPASKQVSSLALLESEVPFHKMPLTRVHLDGGELFWDSKVARTCFAEFGTPDPETKAQLAIIQRFDAPYRPLKEPTKFAQQFALHGHKKQRFAHEDEREGGRQEDDFGGQAQGMDDEEDLTPEEIQELLQLMGQGGQEQGPEGGFPEEGEDLPEQGGFPEEELGDEAEMAELQQAGELGGGDEMGQIIDALNVLASGQQELTQAVQGLSGGIAQNAQTASPPPVISKEPTANAVRFNETTAVALGNSATTSSGQSFAVGNGNVPPMPGWAVGLQASFVKLQENQEKTQKLVEYLFAEREEDQLYAHLETECDKHSKVLFSEGFKESEVAKAHEYVTKRLEDKVALWRAGQLEAKNIDAAVFFAEVRQGLVPSSGGSIRPQNAPITTATPSGLGDVGAAEITKFVEDSDDPWLKDIYNANRSEIGSYIAELRTQWAEIQQTPNLYDDEADYLRKEVHARFSDYGVAG